MKLGRYLVGWIALAAAVLCVWLLGGQSGGEGLPIRSTAPSVEPAAAGTPSPTAIPATHNPIEGLGPAAETAAPEPGQTRLAGVWVPYMALAARDHTQAAFEENFKSIADSAHEKGLNALFVHVRAFSDALYPSELYPWSHLLTGEQGKDPGFDPLAFMVEYTHSLGMEFHAWINPLRVRTAETPAQLSADNPYEELGADNPYYFMEWEGAVYLDPAYPYVRSLIAQGAAEIAEKYPVDGIHFDDYFYPTQDESLDAEAYALYQETVGQPLPLLEWRTANINAMVEEVYGRVKAAREGVRFGISPQGNLDNDANMGADVETWCALPGYIDYICPQLYYGFENPALSFSQAMDQWQALTRREGLELYIGLALYKAGDPEQGADWAGGDVISRQIQAASAVACDGVILYSSAYLDTEQTQEEMGRAVETLAEAWQAP